MRLKQQQKSKKTYLAIPPRSTLNKAHLFTTAEAMPTAMTGEGRRGDRRGPQERGTPGITVRAHDAHVVASPDTTSGAPAQKGVAAPRHDRSPATRQRLLPSLFLKLNGRNKLRQNKKRSHLERRRAYLFPYWLSARHAERRARGAARTATAADLPSLLYRPPCF